MSTFKQNINLGNSVPLIKTPDIGDKQVTERKLADGSVSSSKLSTDIANLLSLFSTHITAFKTADSLSSLPREENTTGWIVDNHLYVYVGNGSAPETGMYQDCGELRGPQGIQGEQGLSGINGKSAYEIWKEQPGNEDKTEIDFLAFTKGSKGDKGEQGDRGYDISNIEQIVTSSEDGGKNVIRVTRSDGWNKVFEVKNGSKGSKGDKGTSIVKLEKTKVSTESSGLNIVTATLDDGSKETIELYNGAKGEKGDQGAKGDKGDQGATGPQGNSGVTDASTKTLVNDAVTGGETDYLSAEVGKLGILTYDCSKGGTVTHANLQDAINAVPTTFQKVGLTITYKSGGTIYRYTLKSNAWSTDPANWFSVEDKLSDLEEYVGIKNVLQIKVLEGKEIGSSNILPFKVRAGEKFYVRMDDQNNILSSGDGLFFAYYADGTRDIIMSKCETNNDYLIPAKEKNITSIYWYTDGAYSIGNGNVTLMAWLCDNIENKIEELNSKNADTEKKILALQEQKLDAVAAVTRIVSVNAYTEKKTGVFEIKIKKGESYSVSVTDEDSVLTGNYAFYRLNSDGTRDYDQLSLNSAFRLIATKDIIGIYLYISGEVISKKGNIVLRVQNNRNVTSYIRDIELSDNDKLNNIIRELYIPNKKSSDILKIRVVKKAPKNELYYNALYIWFVDGTNTAIFTDTFSTSKDADNNCKGIRGQLSRGYAVIDYTSAPDGETDFTDFLLNYSVNTLAYCPQLYDSFSSKPNGSDWLHCFFESAVCIGDSITEGNIYDFPYHNGVVNKLSYPFQLSKMTGWTITNLGKSGYSAKDWYDKEFSKYSFSRFQLAFIYLGTNGGLSINSENSEQYNNYVAYKALIEGILKQNEKIIVFLIIGSNLSSDSDLETIYTIKTVGADYKLPVFDLRDTTYLRLLDDKYHGFTDDKEESLNYTHFNAIGYLALARLIHLKFINWCSNNEKTINDKRMYDL